MKTSDELKAGLWDRREGSVKLPSNSCQSKGAQLRRNRTINGWFEDGRDLFLGTFSGSNFLIEQQ